MAKQTLLHHPIKDAPLALTSDASDFAIGAVLEQRVGGQWQPLAFFSRQFKKAELGYATFDKELTGVLVQSNTSATTSRQDHLRYLQTINPLYQHCTRRLNPLQPAKRDN